MRKYSVLIVDNAAYARERISNMLSRAGFAVAGEAKDVAAAVDGYKRLKPDLVTLDLFLTGEHGFTALKAILKLDPSARIVILSAMADSATIDMGIALGAKAFVIKTEDIAELKKALQTAIGDEV